MYKKILRKCVIKKKNIFSSVLDWLKWTDQIKSVPQLKRRLSFGGSLRDTNVHCTIWMYIVIFCWYTASCFVSGRLRNAGRFSHMLFLGQYSTVPYNKEASGRQLPCMTGSGRPWTRGWRRRPSCPPTRSGGCSS